MRPSAVLLLVPPLLALSGCDLLPDSVKDAVKAPSAELARVDLVDAPTARQAVAWACYEWLNANTCELAGFGRRPSAADMRFSFDLVFSLTNENDDIPIPLVELLLGITVIEDNNLGSVCVSFCDPDTEDCEAESNLEDACTVDDETTEVKEPSDVVPTVDGETGEDNNAFRVVPPGETVESHITFDLQPTTVYALMEEVLVEAAEDWIAGRNVRLEVPYAVDGTVFFDVPRLGEYAIAFGPYEDSFPLEEN
jgi:hypothetical protein